MDSLVRSRGEGGKEKSMEGGLAGLQLQGMSEGSDARVAM